MLKRNNCYAELENDTQEFLLANPKPKFVPKPISVFSLLTMVADGLNVKRSQDKKA